jgi:Holliday junction resolvase-like predicted endonuclease
VLEREGFSGVAKLLEEKFPSEDNPFSVRTGDFGEVVGHMVLQDLFGFTIPVFKLRYKTNWERAAFGIDIIAFRLHDNDPQKDTVVFAEVKTSKTKDYGVKTVFEEIESLVAEGLSEARQKMRNAVRFVSERLFEQQQYELERRIYRFLDCYTNPHYVEAFFPFLVRDKRTWGEDALDGIVVNKLDPNRVVLCVFLIGNLEEAIQAAYEIAAKIGDEID